jgi:RNA ligase
MNPLLKYPRTQHLEGSRLQPGDEDLDSVPFDDLVGKFLVVEEKIDGANAGLSFEEDGTLRLQSRGHYLIGGSREKHFDLFKQWASCHAPSLFEKLGSRHVLYGEWLYAKHTIFYDRLPHYFLEFDVYDRETELFLSTERRRELLAGLPLVSVPVLRQGKTLKLEDLTALVGPSLYKSVSWSERLTALCHDQNLDPERVWKETDPSDLMEGLYVKHEEEGRVVGRYKWIRAGFLTTVVDSGTHWLRRPIIPNQLAEDADLFGGAS